MCPAGTWTSHAVMHHAKRHPVGAPQGGVRHRTGGRRRNLRQGTHHYHLTHRGRGCQTRLHRYFHRQRSPHLSYSHHHPYSLPLSCSLPLPPHQSMNPHLFHVEDASEGSLASVPQSVQTKPLDPHAAGRVTLGTPCRTAPLHFASMRGQALWGQALSMLGKSYRGTNEACCRGRP